VVESAEHAVGQPNRRLAIWGRPEGIDLYLRVVITGDRRILHNAFSTLALPVSRGEIMKVSYLPDTDSLFVKLKPGLEAEGAEVAPGIVFYYTPDGEITAIDFDSKASELVDLSSLEIEGLPVKSSPAPRQQSKAV
jgi:uncharacterized protein YuzE